MYNPFDGIKPGFGPFAPIFSSWVGILLAALWAAALVYVAVHLILAIAAMAKARRQHRADPEATAWGVLWPIGTLIALALVPVIYVTATTTI